MLPRENEEEGDIALVVRIDVRFKVATQGSPSLPSTHTSLAYLHCRTWILIWTWISTRNLMATA